MPKAVQKITLTKRSIEALRTTGQRYYVNDSKQPGLAVVVTEAGSKAYYYVKWVDGRTTRKRLGGVAEFSVDHARRLAAREAGKIAAGEKPQPARQRRQSVGALFELWLAHAKLRKKSWRADEKNWANHAGDIVSRPAASLTRADVERWHHRLGETRGPVIANRMRALLSAVFSKYDGPNPCARVARFPERSRERFLQSSEMPAFLRAVEDEPEPWRSFWLLCLFTGSRRGSVQAMRWKDIDLGSQLWHLPAEQSKNGQPLVIVLPPPAVEILEERLAERPKDGEFVFSSGDSHIKDPRKSWTRVVAAAGIEDLHPHDLRRTLASWQAAAGISLAVVGASLGHRDIKSTQVYARLQTEPVRKAVSATVARLIDAGSE